jgi:transcription elongation factor Elf1
VSSVVSFHRFAYMHSGEWIPGLPDPASCPFCGHVKDVTIEWRGYGYYANCDHCGADGPPGTSPLEAARNWNGRGREGQAHQETRQ